MTAPTPDLIRQITEALTTGRIGCVYTTDDAPEYWPDCQPCQGAGRTGECTECGGDGDLLGDASDEDEDREPCRHCEGTGMAVECPACEGLGKVRPAAPTGGVQ